MDFGGGEEETLEERVRREHLEGLEQGNITGKAVRVSTIYLSHLKFPTYTYSTGIV